MDPNGRDLSRYLPFGPNTGQALDSLGTHPQVPTTADQRLFDPAHEFHRANTGAKGPQIKDGITHKLPRSVESYVASTIGLDQLNPFTLKGISGSHDVLHSGIAAQSDYRGML